MLLTEVRCHQVNQVAGPEPAHPCVADEPGRRQQRQHAEQICPRHAEPDRLLLVVRRQAARERRNAQHIVHRKKALDEHETGNDGKTVEDFLRSHVELKMPDAPTERNGTMRRTSAARK